MIINLIIILSKINEQYPNFGLSRPWITMFDKILSGSIATGRKVDNTLKLHK